MRVEVDESETTAIWPLSSKVEIMEDLPDGGAEVRVWLSRVRIGRISAETVAQRTDWNVNIKAMARRTVKQEEKQRLLQEEIFQRLNSFGNCPKP